MLLAVFLLIGEQFILPNKYIKINLQRLTENTNKKESKYTTSFEENGLKIQNHSTNGTITINYDNFSKLVETKHTYSLFTRANQFAPIFKENLEITKQEDLIKFVKEKCPKIKLYNVNKIK